MTAREYTEVADDRELTLLGMADAYEQIRTTYGPALEVMRQVAAHPNLPRADRPTITLKHHGGVVVQLLDGHNPGWARVLASVLDVDLDTEPSWVSGDGCVWEWESGTRPRRSLMLDNHNGDIA
jgi:hypothetical protein